MQSLNYTSLSTNIYKIKGFITSNKEKKGNIIVAITSVYVR